MSSNRAFWRDHWRRGPRAVAERFNRLGPADARRLFSQVGLTVGEVEDFGSWENRVYGCDVADPPTWLGDGRLIVKFYRAGRWSKESLEDEQRFVDELFEAGVSVAAPVEFPDGSRVGEDDGIYFSLSHRLPGDRSELEDKADPTEDQVRALGALTARMHNVGERAVAAKRPTTDLASETLGSLEFMRETGLIGEFDGELSALCDEFAEHCAGLGASPPALRIHADLGMNNVLWGADGPTLMDFDDFQNGFAVQDLALADWFYSVDGRDDLAPVRVGPDGTAEDYERHSRNRAGVRSLLLEGYQEHRHYDLNWERWNQPCLFAREIFCAAWFCGRSHDDAFMKLWGKKVDSAFWPRVIQLTRLRLRFMQRHPEGLPII